MFMKKLNSFLKEPVLYFLLFGVLLYVSYQSFNNYLNRDKYVITVSQEEIQMLDQSWQMRWNRPPTPEEKEGLLKKNIRDKVLYRTAIEMGLDKEDMVIQRRMVQKIEYLGADIIQPPQPNEAELVAYFEEHKDEYKLPEIITMTHLFYDPDKRGETTLDDANKALARLNAQNDPNSNLSEFGDAFMLANYYPNKTEMEIRKHFGSGFTESVFELETGKWHGPVLSGYGTHLVFVHNHEINEMPEYTDVRDMVRVDWMAMKKAELEQQYIDGLMARYEIVIEK
jgi:peptidyl-prolyl cis-trans isomerase C